MYLSEKYKWIKNKKKVLPKKIFLLKQTPILIILFL